MYHSLCHCVYHSVYHCACVILPRIKFVEKRGDETRKMELNYDRGFDTVKDSAFRIKKVKILEERESKEGEERRQARRWRKRRE